MAAIQITRELANASAMDAANSQMRKAGRKAWNEDDYNLSVATFNRLWPLEAEYLWMTKEQADAIRAREGVSHA